ncbi:MAG: hypothetical protein ACLUNW_07065 [Prevotella sp.]
MDKTQEHYEKDTKLNTDQPPLFIPFFLDFVPQYFFVSSDSFICSTMSCVVENAALLNMVFLYVHVSSAGGRCVVHCCKGCSSCFSMCPRRFSGKRVRGEALFIVVKVVQVVFLYVLGISSQGKGKTICGFMGFPLAARAGNRTFAAENE